MNEHDFFKQMIHDRAVNDAAVKAKAKMQTKRTVSWRRPLAIAAAALAVIVGTVFLIPSARAEVMRWLTATRPEEYLTADPEECVPVEALEILIVPPATEAPKDPAKPTVPGSNEAVIPITDETPKVTPIGSVTNNRIITVCDEPIWQQIAEDFSMKLGETMFDGHDLYLAITMKGLTALPEIESQIGGNATQVRIGKKDLAEYFEGGRVPEAYKNGTVSLYEPMEGRFFLRLNDGTEISFGLLSSIIFPEEHPFRKYANRNMLTDDDRAEISREAIEWLSGRELKGVIQKRNIDQDRDYFFRNGDFHDLIEVDNVLDDLLARSDENGILTGTVRYIIGTDITGTYEVKLEAELGTASFDLKAYRNIGTHSAESTNGAVAWGAETVLISKVGFDFNGTDDDADDRISLYKQRVSMDGVTMTVEMDEAEISALGVRDINIRIDVPESWTQDDREALAASLTFEVLLNGESGDWFVSPYGCALQNDGSVLFKCIKLLKVPYDKLTSIRTISFVPVIRSVKAVDMQTQDDSGRHHESIGILDTEYGKTTWSPYGVTGWNGTFDRIEYPQYAITLNVN
ncbi:MAG: hypothetical protein IJK54_04335 [Clostridia bacterium]|nr:hypothetical protein [Clostridia bacterium]